jgi:hypothetical protein
MPRYPANFELSSLDGSNGFRAPGLAAGDLAGHSVASAGDVDGNSTTDFQIALSGSLTLHGSDFIL